MHEKKIWLSWITRVESFWWHLEQFGLTALHGGLTNLDVPVFIFKENMDVPMFIFKENMDVTVSIFKENLDVPVFIFKENLDVPVSIFKENMDVPVFIFKENLDGPNFLIQQIEGQKWNIQYSLITVLWQYRDSEYPSAGPNKTKCKKDVKINCHNFSRVQRSKGQKDSTVHKSHVRLTCPENMKQLQLSIIVLEQWARYFQCNGHNVKVKGETVKKKPHAHVPCQIVDMPWKYEAVAIYHVHSF